MKIKKREKSGRKNCWLSMLIFFALTAAGLIFSVLCLYNSRLDVISAHRLVWLFGTVVFFVGLCLVSLTFVLYNRESLVKASISVYLFLLFCLALVYILQKTGFFRLINSTDGLQSYLERAGLWMPTLYVILQYLQVIILPIPSVVSTVAGVALFGAFKTMIFSLIGILLGSITAFFIGRRLGYKAVAWIVGEEALKKWQKKLKGKDNLVLTLAFILPLFPDDILCFVAGLSSMSVRYFLIMVGVARSIGVACTCYSFDFIPWNTWWGILIWSAIIGLIVLGFIFVYKYMDRIQTFFQKLHKNK